MHYRQFTRLICLCLPGLLCSAISANGQGRVLFTVAVSSGDLDRQDSPASFALEDVTIPADPSNYRLVEIRGKTKTAVPFQLDHGRPARLWWILSGATPSGAKRVYEFSTLDQALGTNASELRAFRENGGIVVQNSGKNVLRYQHEAVLPPAGKKDLYRRGGFIHPLWSPKGAVLTRIQPPDHLHHYGIWNPWTRTTFEGRSVDFWNLGDGQGTVKVAANPILHTGPVFADIAARHEHVDLSAPHPSGAKTALDEIWHIRVWNSGSENGPYLVDVQSILSCATDSAFKINAYRYQGFGFRATEKWDDRTAVLLSSEGKNKSDGNATRARWLDVRGVSDFGRSGILFMTHPLNHNFPEQLRIWPTGINEGKENVFINFNPAQEQDWVLLPGKSYTLNYRMLVYDGELSPETMEKRWRDYAHPPKVTLLLNGPSEPKRVLVYTKNGKGYVHDNRAASVQAIQQLGLTHGFSVDASENPADIAEDNLKKYHLVVLSNTNNETFDTDAQKLAFQRYIQAGGGLVGIHSASGSERQWPWFWRTLGGKFKRHPPLQSFDIQVVDHYHPSTLHLGEVWPWEDECYYLDQLNPAVHVLLAADMNTIEDDKKGEYPATTFGNRFPLSWCYETSLGRVWYTALGHKIEYYANPDFQQHLLGGILWVLDGANQLDYSKATNALQMD